MKTGFWVALGWALLGCGSPDDASSSGGGSGGTKSDAAGGAGGVGGVPAGGSAGVSAAGGMSGGAGLGGGSTAGAGGVATAPGIIEKGPDCVPRGPSPEQLGAAHEVLFDAPAGNVTAIETGPSGAYVATDTDLYRIAKGSTTPELVVADNEFGYSNSPGADGMLRVDATHVYWASKGDIRRAGVADFEVETIVPGMANVDFLELDEQNVYFCVREENVIYKAPLSGGAPIELSRDELGIQDMKVMAGYVYVSEFNTGNVVRFPVEGGPVESVAPIGLFTLGIRPSADTVYWADDGGIYATPIASPTERTRLSRPTSSGPFGAARVNNIVLRGDRLYWRDSTGSVGWTKTDGSECDVTIAGDASDFGVDDEHVYVDQARVALD